MLYCYRIELFPPDDYVLTITFWITWMFVEMIVLPPAAPPASINDFAEFSIMYGQMELKGRLPPCTDSFSAGSELTWPSMRHELTEIVR
jgi:hypothetical protein